jgi:hypothetical protein
MKSVALHPFFCEATGQAKGLRQVWLRAMKCGIETDRLGHSWRCRQDGADRRQVVWLVEWRQRDQLRQIIEQRASNPDWRGIIPAAVDNPVTNATDPALHQLLPGQQNFTCR